MSILASHLVEICRILDLAPAVVETIFGPRVLPALDTWRDLVPRAGVGASCAAPGSGCPTRLGPGSTASKTTASSVYPNRK
jgi:hypothetical protein